MISRAVSRLIWRRLALAVLAAGALAGPALAQYPDKPIKLVVPYPPGGPIDTTARVVAQQITARVGQVVVENRPGAGATLGARSVATAEPDGYTLLFGSSGSLAVAPALYSNAGYDSIKSFAPVAGVALLPHVFVIAPSLPAKSVAEFVAYAKAHPGKLNYGAAIGTPPHLLGTLFKVKAGIDLVYVPYKGSAQSVTDLLGGQTQMTIDGLTGLYPLIGDGKLRAIAVASATRWPLLPDVPTLAESGFPDFVIDAWTGVVAPTGTPAGTPADIVARLNAAINEGLKSVEARTSLEKISAVAKLGTPADFAAFLAAELPKWAEVVKVSGAKVD
jgi:tripartite-type tricarboxylate transporter receptor subunit TctC